MEWFKNIDVIWQVLLATTFTYLITAIGASVIFIFKKINKMVINLMMGLASGIMIAASFWSLLLPAITRCEQLGRAAYLEPALGVFFGGIFVMGSDIFLSKRKEIINKSNALLVTSVTLHNIPEGMAIGVAFATAAIYPSTVSLISAVLLALGIGIQNFPEGLCIVAPLRKSGMSRKKSFMIGQFSGIVEIGGGLIGVLFTMTIQNILPFILSFSAGAMIAVVCSELIPEAFQENKTSASFGLIIGFILMMVFDIAFG